MYRGCWGDQVDVRGDPNRSFMFDHSGTFYVPGNKTVIAVPFRERTGLFPDLPLTYGSNSRAPTREGEFLLTFVRGIRMQRLSSER